MGISHFRSVIEIMQNNYLSVLNYFEKRSTNASAESFNAKIKAFRTQFRGVRNMTFLLSDCTKFMPEYGKQQDFPLDPDKAHL